MAIVGLQPGTVAVRELDGCPFPVIILRAERPGLADVAYVDDGNVERDVPCDEIVEADEATLAEIEAAGSVDRRWQEGLLLLSQDDAERSSAERPTTSGGSSASRPATASGMRWEQGRYVADDGAVIFTADGAADRLGVSAKDAKITGQPACGAGIRGIRFLRRSRLEMQTVAAA